MDPLDGTNMSGNILIKHRDKWHGDYYLKEDLTFTPNIHEAAMFYLLKFGNTTIINGDRISINSGNRTLVYVDTGDQESMKLIDREQITSRIEKSSFIITNGTEDAEPISFESSIFIIINKQEKIALRYEWGMDLIDNSLVHINSDESTNTYPNAANYRPREYPKLVSSSYGPESDVHFSLFQLIFERATVPIVDSDYVRDRNNRNTYPNNSQNDARGNYQTVPEQSAVSKSGIDLNEGYKGAIMIVLLMIILLLCIILNR